MLLPDPCGLNEVKVVRHENFKCFHDSLNSSPPLCSSFATENRDFMQDNSTVNTAHTANANFKRLLSGFTRRHLLACHLIAFEPERYPTFYDVAFFLRRVQSFNNIARFSTAPTWWSELVEDSSARDFYVKISRNRLMSIERFSRWISVCRVPNYNTTKKKKKEKKTFLW